ncbi:biotin--[acetyl-CoA-carboxylase] ligase [Clostridium sporogenes]|uniref:Bifunctional ligase/repressor BirA n=1 Tax=Clostridium botulinum TaxID=1491 RepID=A0A6M0T7B3_CLOBO|nr:biotin--[acetyl-CoA-carboxylase] ligase [Clostridium sporogenes]NFA62011.1 biotin--[acetyl-CoA-carboxylase] ligase [Clostridium botulinum]NFI72206.1 biotin--[acetyl-CoA-carboxylase] ligase [Clostridium sporogenes]NFM26190.1 biotin--[acetyl-CoA-carboxylase] ligase [Clostridium sporogenes]NFP60946.1 biotin--[acetyl-CoA-carboxylase] ligase [Clostridium sporogenes]NFU94634.1 biotin--[acetyl-CoA-carboxylase] ligase [Clostridium sporogenes]
MKEAIINILKNSSHTFISGQYISNKLGVSRTAIWKYINGLKKEGYNIESSSKKGYKLISCPDILTFEEIVTSLKTKFLGQNIIHFDSINSTNDKAKKIALSENDGTIIISEEQTIGKGRLGRSWSSHKFKGIYMSIILKPDINTMDVPKITQVAAAAVVTALLNNNIEAYIKWPNDIIVNNKKVCGILTEMSGEINKVNYVVVGIGINVNSEKEDIPKDLLEKATSLKIEEKKDFKRNILVADILNNFEKLYTELIEYNNIDTSIEICKKNSILIGKEVKIINRNREKFGKAVGLNSNGELLVQFENGEANPLISGEISVRGLNGYI